ncbi:MAG: hypothetical protein GY723_11200 [bacterium]|nr:hypothetical protein [bacterium]MCP5065650.1 hypothetical protein [bacterium]
MIIQNLSDARSVPVVFLAAPAQVEVHRTDSKGRESALGRGTLIDSLEVGKRIRISLEGQTLTTTEVQAIEPTGNEVYVLRTENRVYRVQRLGQRTEDRMATTRHRLEMLRGRSRNCSTRNATGLTNAATVATPPKPGFGSFSAGSRIHVTRIRGGDPLVSPNGSLGLARLLDDLEIGACARFALDEGATMATSSIRGLQRLGPSSIQATTGNSTYRFDLLQ